MVSDKEIEEIVIRDDGIETELAVNVEFRV